VVTLTAGFPAKKDGGEVPTVSAVQERLKILRRGVRECGLKEWFEKGYSGQPIRSKKRSMSFKDDLDTVVKDEDDAAVKVSDPNAHVNPRKMAIPKGRKRSRWSDSTTETSTPSLDLESSGILTGVEKFAEVFRPRRPGLSTLQGGDGEHDSSYDDEEDSDGTWRPGMDADRGCKRRRLG